MGILIGMVIVMIIIGVASNFMKGKREAEENLKDKED